MAVTDQTTDDDSYFALHFSTGVYVLDLNGYTLITTGYDDAIEVIEGATLTVNDSLNGQGKVESPYNPLEQIMVRL